MKVLIKRNTIVGGKGLDAGQVHDLSTDDAELLIRKGKAVEAPPEEPKPKPARKVKGDAAE